MKKILVSVFAALGLLMAVPVLAAAVAPVPSPTGATMTITGSAALGSQQTQSANAMRVMPCPIMMQQSGGTSNMMYKQMPCGAPVYGGVMGYNGFGHDTVSWLGIMFVVTVVLVWAILLLIIALLWKHLQKHKHDHHHHHEHN